MNTATEVVLNSHLDIIRTVILKQYPSVEAIILYGGYGRGEGAWIKCNDVYEPYNDYDILIVSRVIDKSRLNNIKKSLLNCINIQWIDISVFSTRKMRSLKPSIFNFDLKYGSKLIYGSSDMLSIIREFESSAIPLFDIRVLFETRLFCLIGFANKGLFDKGIIESAEAQFFVYQMTKAILACVDCILVTEKLYVASYRRRVEIVIEKKLGGPRLIRLARWAIRQKLSPSSKARSGSSCERLYKIIRGVFLKVFLQGLKDFYRAPELTPNKILQLYHLEPFNILRRLYHFALISDRYIKISQSYQNQVDFIFRDVPCKFNSEDAGKWEMMRLNTAKERLLL